MVLRGEQLRALFRCLLFGFFFWSGVACLGVGVSYWLYRQQRIAEFDTPVAPQTLQAVFPYLAKVWQHCVPLGFTLIDFNSSVYVGEAECRGLGTAQVFRHALRQDLATYEREVLWMEEEETLFLIAWRPSGAECARATEHAFLIDGTRVILIRGELICKKGRVAGRERQYLRALEKRIKHVPRLPSSISCTGTAEASTDMPNQ